MTQSELQSQPDAPPKRMIGEYEVIRELGRGAMGVVYKCHEATLNRMVALKLLAPHLAKDESFLKRFRREARAVAQLNHPNVVTIYNIGRHDDSQYLVMEYVQGKTLADLIVERGKLDLQTALQIARQIALALDAAHRVNIVHRDIKPQNVMVDHSGRAKVMDFGIAKVDEEAHTGLTNTGQVLGTPNYMSPEQLRGEEVDGRSDIFALGITLYEMIAGTLPFSGHTAVVVIQKILFEQPRPIKDYLDDIPEPLMKILERAMAKKKEDRYGSAAEMALDIQRLLTGSESGAMHDFDPPQSGAALKQTGWLERVQWRWNHTDRRKRLAIGGIAAGAGLGVALVALLSGQSDPPQDSAKATQEEIGVEAPSKAMRPPVNQPPKIIAALDRTEIRMDENATLTASATDPESDPFQLEHRMDEGVWAPMPAGGLTLSGLTIGTHTLELRAFDDLGQMSDAWKKIVTVSPDRVSEALGLYTGSMGRVDEARAKVLMTEAAEAGSPLATMWMAWFTHWGRCGVDRDPDKADAMASQVLSTVGTLAQQGNTDAQFLMGAAYDQAIGVEENTELAVGWIKTAAEAGGTIAMNYLGYMHVEGRGVAKDPVAAAEWFTRGAEAGDVAAMHNLGWMYARGQGVDRDDARALEWFRRGAELGSARNMGSLGYMFQQGQGTEKNLDEAKNWYRLAAAMGDLTAQRNLTSLGETW